MSSAYHALAPDDAHDRQQEFERADKRLTEMMVDLHKLGTVYVPNPHERDPYRYHGWWAWLNWVLP